MWGRGCSKYKLPCPIGVGTESHAVRVRVSKVAPPHWRSPVAARHLIWPHAARRPRQPHVQHPNIQCECHVTGARKGVVSILEVRAQA